MKRMGWIAFVLTLLLTIHLDAAIINVGQHNVAPNAVTSIQILIQREAGDPDIAGMNLAIQTGDGVTGPTVSLVDLVTGTPFDGNNTGNVNVGSSPRQAFWRITTASGTVPIVDGRLVTMNIDTTGLSGGTFSLILSSVLGAPTELLDATASPISLTVNDGTIIVPEPTTLALLIVGGLGSIVFRRKAS